METLSTTWMFKTFKGQFGHSVTKINTIFVFTLLQSLFFRTRRRHCFGNRNLANVKYRPLAGNEGYQRHSYIDEQFQNNNVDGRKDMVLTEAGLKGNQSTWKPTLL